MPKQQDQAIKNQETKQNIEVYMFKFPVWKSYITVEVYPLVNPLLREKITALNPLRA